MGGSPRCIPPGWAQGSPRANLASPPPLQEAGPFGGRQSRAGRFVVTAGSVTPALWAASWSPASSAQFLRSRAPRAAAGRGLCFAHCLRVMRVIQRLPACRQRGR